MTAISDAIARIATIAEQRQWANLADNLVYENFYETCRSQSPEDLKPEQRELVEEHFNGYRPRLSRDDIQAITQEFQFELPIELYDLYEKGNGCLPIGTASDKDWDSIYSYFVFPNSHTPLWNLRKSMNAYGLLIDFNNPQLFPICSFEDESTLLIVGDETQQESSPVLRTHDLGTSPPAMTIAWPSLTSMLLAYAELYELMAIPKQDMAEVETKAQGIYQKYSDHDRGWNDFWPY